MDEQKQGFSFTYSAQQQDEVEAIRRKYLPPREDKLELLRRLDRAATRRATMLAVTVGLAASLVMGTGMSMCLVWTDRLLVPGIAVGLAGLVGVALAFPLYRHALKKEQAKIAPQVLRLADELRRQ